MFGANEPFWAQKIVHPGSSGSAPRIFIKFCTMKANRYMKVILMVFMKKILFVEMGHFGSENGNFGSINGTLS